MIQHVRIGGCKTQVLYYIIIEFNLLVKCKISSLSSIIHLNICLLSPPRILNATVTPQEYVPMGCEWQGSMFKTLGENFTHIYTYQIKLGFQICWASRASKLRFYLVYFTDFVCGKSTMVSKKIEMPSCNLRKGNTIAGVFISYYLRVKKA